MTILLCVRRPFMICVPFHWQGLVLVAIIMFVWWLSRSIH
jgi:hypothetical protein